MLDEEKEAINNQFCYQDVSILVATTVVEVGVDVKNADMMIIYDAERFGLSQLHQLRGRIGRSGQQGKCYLLTNNEDEDTIKRLKFLQECDDGFEISRFDLQNRGPGELSGIKQSGVMNLRIANIVDDLKIFEVSRTEANNLYSELTNFQYRGLKELVDAYLIKNVEVIE
jgi:ATP-dependent DNA helicase RecG